MQRPCERENRTRIKWDWRNARVSVEKPILLFRSILPSHPWEKKRKKVQSIAMSVSNACVPSRIETTGSDPWIIARVSACQRVARAAPLPPPTRSTKEFVDCCTRVICASTSTKWLSLPAFQTSRVSPSVRSPSSISPPPRRRGGEAFAGVKERSRCWRPRGGCEIVAGCQRAALSSSSARLEIVFKARSRELE